MSAESLQNVSLASRLGSRPKDKFCRITMYTLTPLSGMVDMYQCSSITILKIQQQKKEFTICVQYEMQL